MSKTPLISALLVTALLAGSASAAQADGVERLHYRWSLKGAFAWIARVAFPASGSGTLETRAGSSVTSRLTIGSQGASAYYASSMTPDGMRTFASEDGYNWNDRFQHQSVTFDYDGGVARVEKRSEDGVEQKVRSLDSTAAQDVLTSIYYLRQNAESITTQRTATVYTGGKPYQFVFTPLAVMTMNDVRVRPFTIAPVDARKRGAVKVWLSDDQQHKPVRIEIEQKHATLRLDLDRQ